MFTGIITATGKVKKIKKNKNFILSVETDNSFVKKIKPGSSVAVDGVCLTVAKISGNSLVFAVMPETVKLTIANDYKVGVFLNLESSLRVGDELGGHFVSGHVDGLGEIVDIKKDQESVVFGIKIAKKLVKYLSHKGSITINGVSLTLINPLKKRVFQVSLVNFTLEHTNLSKLEISSFVNIEVDLLARYLNSIVYFDK